MSAISFVIERLEGSLTGSSASRNDVIVHQLLHAIGSEVGKQRSMADAVARDRQHLAEHCSLFSVVERRFRSGAVYILHVLHAMRVMLNELFGQRRTLRQWVDRLCTG
ncbi:MAG: hypothetical protein JSR83_19965 [Proteobacteria bacterium]|nr:hypothetical protein [Pseudomonadota bacterium]